MRFLGTFSLLPFLGTLAQVTAALLLGTAIGAERQYRQRTADLRTNALVALGAAAIVDRAADWRADGVLTRDRERGVRHRSLGAGVIMNEGTNVRGLNTAATLWCSAAVGAYAGSATMRRRSCSLYSCLRATLYCDHWSTQSTARP